MHSHLKELVAALRESGVSCYEGWVPGWPEGKTVKLVLGSAPAAVGASTAPEAPRVKREETPAEREDRLERAALNHVRLHGERSAD